MKVVFCGTPAFAVPTLQALHRAKYEIALVVSQPDRPTGRRAVMTPPAVKVEAGILGLPVVQPEKIRNNTEFRERLELVQPDVIVIVAYGRIIPRWMLDLPRYGNLNLHGSLLPKYRGAAPIQWALASGESVTGLTTMRIDEGLDTGDILLQEEVAVGSDATSEEMFPVMAEVGAGLMVRTLEGLAAGSILARSQDDGLATLAPILKREDALVDFSRSAQVIYDRWRGFQPWPGAFTYLGGKKLTLARVRPADGEEAAQQPGTIAVEDGRLFVACGEKSWLEVIELQLEGKKRLTAAEFLRGNPVAAGSRLG